MKCRNRRRFAALLIPLGLTVFAGCEAARISGVAEPLAADSASNLTSAAPPPAGPAAEAYRGYSLFAPLRSTETYLINMDKQIVHSWSAQYSPGSAVYLLENGDLLRGAREPENPHFRGGGIGSRIQRFDWDGNLVWDFDFANEQHCPHHDIAPLPNGNILMIAWEKKSKEEAIAQGRDPALLSDDDLWPDFVVEVKPTGPGGGEVVWEWHLWDHLVQDFAQDKPNFGVIYEHPQLVDLNNVGSTPPATSEELRKLRSLGYTGGGDDDSDQGGRRRGRPDWIHSNAIDYNSELDQIAISAKNFSEIWVIDHSTTTEEAASHRGGKQGKGGDLLYRWGNPWSYKSGTIADKKLFDQHDVRWIPAGHPGEGHLMAFNNGSGREYSSIVEIEPPLDGDGEYVLNDEGVFGPAELSWEYTADTKSDFYAGHISGAMRLPNGNTLICNGETGHFFEVNSAQETLWEFTQPWGGELGRNGQQNDPLEQAREVLKKRSESPNGRGFIEEHNAVFRAIKFDPDYPAFASRTLVPLSPQPEPFADVVEREIAKLEAEAEAEAAATAGDSDEAETAEPAAAAE